MVGTNTYLIEVAHLFGERRVHENLVIDAPGRQYVKYWYHNHFKKFGFNPSWATDKHTIDIGGGEVVDLEYIEKVSDPEKAAYAKKLLPQFPKE